MESFPLRELVGSKLLSLCLLCGTVSASAQQTVAEQYFFMSINQERAAAGLPAVVWNDSLILAARHHAWMMGRSGTLAHQLQGEQELSVRAASMGARFSTVLENIAEGRSPLDIQRALMHSPHHRENILDSHVVAVGIAVIPYRGELWVVEDFADSVRPIPLDQQEQRVLQLLGEAGLQNSQATENVREMCRMTSGFVGVRPLFVMRFTAKTLSHLPDEVSSRIAASKVSRAEVGACPNEQQEFSMYNLAIALYR